MDYGQIQDVKREIVRQAGLLHEYFSRSQGQLPSHEQVQAAKTMLDFLKDNSNPTYRRFFQEAYSTANSQFSMCPEGAIRSFGETVFQEMEQGRPYAFNTKDTKQLEKYLDSFLIGMIRSVSLGDDRLAVQKSVGYAAIHAQAALMMFGGPGTRGFRDDAAVRTMLNVFGSSQYDWLVNEAMQLGGEHIRCSKDEILAFGRRVFSEILTHPTPRPFQPEEMKLRDCLFLLLEQIVRNSGIRNKNIYLYG